MGVFKRIGDMTKATIHEVLDKVEDPIIMLNQYLREMEEDIAKAEVTVAKQIANERKLKHRMEEANRAAQAWEEKASEAVLADQDELAKQALAQKITAEQKVAEYTQMYTTSKAQADELTTQLHEMKDEFYQMRNKRKELVARAQMAKATQQIAQVSVSHSIDNSSASRGFERMEEKIMQLEVEAEMARSPHRAHTPTVVAKEHEQQVELELQQLKQKMTNDASTQEQAEEGK